MDKETFEYLEFSKNAQSYNLLEKDAKIALKSVFKIMTKFGIVNNSA